MPTRHHLVIGFYIGPIILYTLLLTGRCRFNTFPLEAKRNSVYVTRICRYNLSSVLRSDGQIPLWINSTKISHVDALMLALDAQYTEQEYCCPTTDKHGTKNAAVLHLARSAIILETSHRKRTGNTKLSSISQYRSLFTVSYSRYNHPAVLR
jgi:hypothetical protein